MFAQNMGTAVWFWNKRRDEHTKRLAVSWILAQGAAVALFCPWLPTALRQITSWSPPSDAYRLQEALVEIVGLLNFGQTIPAEVAIGGLIAAGASVFLSLLPPVDDEDVVDDRQRDGELSYMVRWGMIAFLVVIPVGLILALGLYREAYQKFLLVAAAPLAILVARGWVSGWRIASGIGVWGDQEGAVGYRAVMLFIGALYLFDSGRSLNNLYFDEEYARADYRAIAAHIEELARPGDAIILNAPNQWEVFTYYFPNDENVFPLARQRPFDREVNEGELEQIAANYERIFAIFWGDAESDPERVIESWLEKRTYKASETWYRDVRLAVYAVPIDVADEPAVHLDVRFIADDGSGGPIIYLEGYTVINGALNPGDILQLALFWRIKESISERYKVFVHLYDRNGRLIAQTDSEPGATLRPTHTWLPGETVIDRYGVMMPTAAPAGLYTVAVGFYELGDPANRLLVEKDGISAGDRLDLAQIVVEAADALDEKD
jgi:hypothetical protein